MADGSVTIAFDANTSDADKKLAKLRSNIMKTEQQIEDMTSKRDAASEKSAILGGTIEGEQRKLAELKAQLVDLQNAAKDKSLSAGVRQELSAQIPSLKDEITEQQQRVTALEREWKTATASVERYDQRIADANVKLDRQASEAGELEAQVASTNSETSKMPIAFESASASLDRFVKRVKGLAKRVFVFTLITRALRALRTWLWNSVQANDEAREAIARLQGALLTLAQPILNVIIPAFTGLVKILTTVVTAVAKVLSLIFGVDLAKSAQQAQKNLEDEANALGGVGSAADDAAGSLAGFDEINTIQTEESGGGGGGGGAGGITPDFSAWENFTNQLSGIEKVVLGIGAALATWKVAKGVSSFLNQISNFTLGGGFAKVSLLASAGIMIRRFIEAIGDIQANGATFDNVTKLIGEFVGAVGTIAALLGHAQFGGALVGISGLADIVRAIKGFVTDGINWENVTAGVEGIGKVLMAIGMLTPYKYLVGAGTFLLGVPTLIDGVKSVVEAIKTGDWSNIDWTSLILGVSATVGGIIQFFTWIKRLNGVTKGAEATSSAINAATGTAEGINAAMGSGTGGGLFGKLKTVAVNMGIGIAIIGEAAIAAGLLIAAAWGLGALLEQVGKSWEPVIENGGTVATAIITGAGIIAAVGGATYMLGSVGATAAANIGIGTAILAEMGVAAGLFIAEIWGIGWGLEQVADSWEPVIEHAETVKTAIEKGSELLLAVGVVTAALGALTVATAGALPLAIGIGTAMLVELSAATIAFTESLVAVADEMTDNLAPALADFNEVLPDLNTNMGNFKDYMRNFAELVVAYSGDEIVAGISAAVADIVKFFTGDPLANFTEEVSKTWDMLNGNGGTEGLASLLTKTNPLLESAATNSESYVTSMESLSGVIKDYSGSETVSLISSAVDTIKGWFSKDPLTKFKNEVKKTYNKLAGEDGKEGLESVLAKTVPVLATASENATSFITNLDALADILNNYAGTGTASGLAGSVTTISGWFESDPLGTLSGIVQGNFDAIAGDNGLNSRLKAVIPELQTAYLGLSSYVSYLNLISETTSGLTFTGISDAIFVDMTGVGSNLVSGFAQGIASAGGVGSPVINGLNAMMTTISGFSWYSIGTNIGTGIVNGMYNIGPALNAWGQALLNSVKNMFAIHSPSRLFRDEVGYYLGTGISSGLADSQSKIMQTVGGISNAMLSAFSGGSKFHFNGAFPAIPRLAQGAVIPPNREFLSVLGDQSSGTNVEAPLETIKQALVEALSESGGGNRPINITMVLDGKVIGKTAIREIRDSITVRGKLPFPV